MDRTEGRKVLVMGEIPQFGDLFELILAQHSDEVKFAANGKGLTAAEEDPPDLIFAYLWDPGPNTLKFYERLKAKPVLRNTPVVFYGAMPPERAYPVMQHLGVKDYLGVPFTARELVEVRNTALEGGNGYS